MAIAAAVVGASGSASAADLPAHDPLRLLLVSDAVNPHGLSDAELTQPGDLEAALADAGNGLNIESVTAVDSQCADEAIDLLATPGSVDVVVYFSHLAATGCDGSPRQSELTNGMSNHLLDGGGVVVFHHGIYEAAGKEEILQLLGGQASSIGWDTMAGQDVIATTPDHFVAMQGVEYSGMRNFGGAGVPDGEYPFFNNNPDERYDALSLLEQGGETRTILFTSADAGGGAARVLGYDLHRPSWGGHVVFYQPGEYQPNALDDLSGNNFQILANAVVYAATTQEEGGGDPTTGDTSGGSASGDDSVDGSGDAGGTDSNGGTGGDASQSGTAGSAGADGGGGGDDEGCGCRSAAPGPSAAWLWLAALPLIRRRRSGERGSVR